MSDRYKIINDSVSMHCCFSYTVVDTTKPEIIGGEQYVSARYGPAFETVCECFTEEAAKLVCDALNKEG